MFKVWKVSSDWEELLLNWCLIKCNIYTDPWPMSKLLLTINLIWFSFCFPQIFKTNGSWLFHQTSYFKYSVFKKKSKGGFHCILRLPGPYDLDALSQLRRKYFRIMKQIFKIDFAEQNEEIQINDWPWHRLQWRWRGLREFSREGT